MDGVRATLVPVDETGRVTVFVFEQAGRRLVYAPCDVKPFPSSPLFEGADCLVVGNTVIGDVLKDGFVLGAGNPLRQELFTLEEIVCLKERLQIPDVVMTHLEEDWGKSYDCLLYTSPLAQLAEHLTFNQGVPSSNLGWVTKPIRRVGDTVLRACRN